MKKFLIIAAAALAILAAYFIVSNLGCESNAKQITETEAEVTEVSEAATWENVCEAVDLGLSVKWATCNVGASNPNDGGLYYAWGETETKIDYTESNCSTKGQNIGNIGGTVHDVALVNWGGNWRMPTKAEFEELRNRCTWSWTGYGYSIIGPNGNSIYLPASGRRFGSGLLDVGERGFYWCSTPQNGTKFAWALYFYSSYQDIVGCDFYIGYSVRPVTE